MNDYQRPSGFQVLPPVVKNLLIINILFYILTYVLYIKTEARVNLNDSFGLHYVTSTGFMPIQFITYMFLHGGFTHILFNMFALWTFGSVLENTWGPKRFLVFYAICGIGAAVTQTAVVGWDIHKSQEAADKYYADKSLDALLIFVKNRGINYEQDSFENRFSNYLFNSQSSSEFIECIENWKVNKNDPNCEKVATEKVNEYVYGKINQITVGASGAIYGLLLAFGMMFPNTLLYLYFAIPIRAKYAVALFGLLELYFGAQNSGSDNVAHFAHLGGMIFGYFLIVSWKKKSFDRFNMNNKDWFDN